MVDVTIVYWRDIPAQVIVGKGRRGAKKQLPERFEQAIDRAAMKTGAGGTDDYLAEWRKAAPYPVEGEPAEVAEAEAARLDAEYDRDRIKALIANDGWNTAQAAPEA
ncbi:virulence factor [Roseovarius nanhaiticus]|uniref:Virulence factor n=1 Tax=Roseovarius nanhaiticus TaxID=573024 RepID=A0A1N7GA73_9RHOB|nr:virulence factor [Roseovarius nanhaiticus]SEK32991.1 Virulence factor [Roseovarius nanhaiticus]SIS09428.1 Virulence factor [Roseovarius nanhaiticus]